MYPLTPVFADEEYQNVRAYVGHFDNDELSFGKVLMNDNRRKKYWRYCDDKDGKGLKRKFIYLLTFTLRPDKQSSEFSEKAEEYIRDISKRDALGIKYLAFVREHTEKGVPHWHVCIETKTALKRNRFQYYEKLYGFIDISRTKGQTTQEALNYMSKEGTPTILIS